MEPSYPPPPPTSLANQVKNSFIKRLPDWTAHFLSMCFHGLFIVFRELGRVISEALGR